MADLALSDLIRQLQEIKRDIKRLQNIRLAQSIPSSTLGDLNDIYIRKLNNLSDLVDITIARANLGLGSMAVEDANDYYLSSAINTLLNGKLTKAGDTMLGSIGFPITTITNDITLDNTHHTILCDASSNPISVNLPGAGTCFGREYYIKIINNTNNVTVIPAGVQTIDGDSDYLLNVNYETLHIQSNGANWFILGVPSVFVS
ncbi:MAG: hypothetical protein ACEQR7_09045 [Agathobacter rectalis]